MLTPVAKARVKHNFHRRGVSHHTAVGFNQCVLVNELVDPALWFRR